MRSIQSVGAAINIPGEPNKWLQAFDITDRVTGRDILKHLTSGNAGLEMNIGSDDPNIVNLVVEHELFDLSGVPNLILLGGHLAISAIRSRLGGQIETERVSLTSRVPWRDGRVFATMGGSLAC